MLNEPRGKIDDLSENFNKEIENVKVKIENTKTVRNEEYITEMKNTSGGINSRLDEMEDQIRDLEDKVAENTQSE